MEVKVHTINAKNRRKMFSFGWLVARLLLDCSCLTSERAEGERACDGDVNSLRYGEKFLTFLPRLAINE